MTAQSMTSFQQATGLDWPLTVVKWPAVAAGVFLHSKGSAVVLKYFSNFSVSFSQLT